MKEGDRILVDPPMGGPHHPTKRVTYCGQGDCLGPRACAGCRAAYMRAWRVWRAGVKARRPQYRYKRRRRGTAYQAAI